MKEAIIEFLKPETPDELPVYDVLTDCTIPVSVRGRIAYEQLKSRFGTLKDLGAAQCE